MNRRLYPILLLLLLSFTACQNSGTTKVSATGSIYECLVVMPSRPLPQPQIVHSASAYDEDIVTTYDLVKAVMAADMPCLPQIEPYFKLTHVTPQAFDDFLKPTRNILMIDIDSARYTTTKAKYSVDYWSHPQALYRIQTPDVESFMAFWQANGQAIREWFVQQELQRQIRFYRASTNKTARAALQRTIGIDLLVPEDYMLIKDTTDFVWCCNNKGSLRRDIVVWSYPYTNAKTFTLDYLNRKRDEVLGQYISASVPGSYMGTEYKFFPPTFRYVSALPNAADSLSKHDFYAAEVRGLWKMYSGEAMGGPFVSLTRLDSLGQRVITTEVFVLAPGQKKRNPLRQAEAILYTLRP